MIQGYSVITVGDIRHFVTSEICSVFITDVYIGGSKNAVDYLGGIVTIANKSGTTVCGFTENLSIEYTALDNNLTMFVISLLNGNNTAMRTITTNFAIDGNANKAILDSDFAKCRSYKSSSILVISICCCRYRTIDF